MRLTIDEVCARRAFRWALNAYQDAAEWRHALFGFQTDAQLDALADLPDSVFQAELIGVERVAVDGATWQPHEDGHEAFITPVWALDWCLVDMVAWHPSTPDRWATRWGIATYLGDVNEYAEETRVFRSPWSWLRAGARGICPLDPAALRSVLPCREDHRIVAEDEAHRRALYDALRRHDTPRILA